MLRCVVTGCPNKANQATSRRGVRLHTFPRDLGQISSWLRLTGQNFGDLDRLAQQIRWDRDVADGVRMCSAHFTKDSYLTDYPMKLLRADALPTVFPKRRAATPPPAVNAELDLAAGGGMLPKEMSTLNATPEPPVLENEAPESSTEKNLSHPNEKVLTLALEMIYLLTGESYGPIKKKSGCPPSPSRTPKGNINKKILEVTQKIIELLTGEVPIRCQDVTVYFSMEEWEYLEGHKDLYKDVMMENQPPLTSPDKSSNGNPPERCPRPLYSRDSTQEDQEIPQDDHQVLLDYSGDVLIAVEAEVNEGAEEPDVTGDDPCMEEEVPPRIGTDRSRKTSEGCPWPVYSRDFIEEHHKIPGDGQAEHLITVEAEEAEDLYMMGDEKEIPPEISTDPGDSRTAARDVIAGEEEGPVKIKEEEVPIEISTEGSRNTQERCPRPLYSRDSTQEHQEIPPGDQVENLITVKVESKEGDEKDPCGVRGDEQCKEEEIPPEISTDPGDTKETQTNSKAEEEEEGPVKIKEEEVPVEISTDGSSNGNPPERCLSPQSHDEAQGQINCMEAEKQTLLDVAAEMEIGTVEEGHGRGNKLSRESRVLKFSVEEERIPAGTSKGKPSQRDSPQKSSYLPKFGSGVITYNILQNSTLAHSQSTSSKRKRLACSLCGKCYISKRRLEIHEESHREQKTVYFCTDCGKSYRTEQSMTMHRRIHSQRIYQCPDCRKTFEQIYYLVLHMRGHSEGLQKGQEDKAS